MTQALRIKQTGEVFTPRSLVREMLEKLPNSVWFDPNKTWLEPAAGDGNFLVEIKARLLQAGHDEQHILDNMLFSIELIDDNHWVLQHRLGYLVDGNPNPKFWPNGEHFDIGTIHRIAQDLNNNNPYTTLGLDKDQVLFHRNHVCTTGLEYNMTFGRGDEVPAVLPLLKERALGAWPETDTPDIGEKYMVEKMLGRQPQLAPQEVVKSESPKTEKQKWGILPEHKAGVPPYLNGETAVCRHIYLLFIIVAGKRVVFYVGQSNDVRSRAASHANSVNAPSKKHETPATHYLIAHGKQMFYVQVVETVYSEESNKTDTTEGLEAEHRWAEKLLAEGHPISNKVRLKNLAKSDGGWGVNPKNYNKGLKIETSFKGMIWEADHDTIVDDINQSLKAAGKQDLFEHPRSFGASSGIRGGVNGGLFKVKE